MDILSQISNVIQSDVLLQKIMTPWYIKRSINAKA